MLLRLQPGLLLDYAAASLIGLSRISLEVILIVIIIVKLDSRSLVALSDVVQLELARDDLGDHVSKLVRVVQEGVTVHGLSRQGPGLADFRLVVIADDDWDDQRLLLLGWGLLDYNLRLLDYLGLLVDWLLLLLLRSEVVCLEAYI